MSRTAEFLLLTEGEVERRSCQDLSGFKIGNIIDHHGPAAVRQFASTKNRPGTDPGGMAT
jgi:hypothetical protein